MPKVIIATTPEERYRIYQFRYQVYVEEMHKKPRAANHRECILTDEWDETATLLYMQEDNQIIATLRRNSFTADTLSYSTDKYSTDKYRWLEQTFAIAKFAAAFPQALFSISSRLMVNPAWRNAACLGTLVSEAYRVARSQNIQFDFLHAAPWLLTFYQHLGYRRYTDHFLDADTGLQIPQVLVMEDIEHLQAVRSPFSRIARQFSNSSITRDWFHQTFPPLPTACDIEQIPLSTAIFQGLKPEEIEQIVRSTAVHSVKPTETIVQIGDVANAMFLILSGAVKVKHAGAALRLDAYQTFGEANLFDPSPSPEQAIALMPTELLILPKPTLVKLIKTMPEAMCRVLLNASRSICERYVSRMTRASAQEVA